MTAKYLISSIIAVLFGTAFIFAQGNSTKPNPPTPVADLQPIRSSPAYAELLLRKTELESSLESLLVDYTEQHPKVKDLRTELALLKPEMDRLLAVKPGDAGKLTVALGRLMLRKIEIETELETLRLQYKDDHPDVKRTKRKVEVFEAAIREILG